MASGNAIISVKELPVLGEKQYAKVSKQNVLGWIEEIQQIRRAHPDLDMKLCVLTQAVRPGILKMLRLTLAKTEGTFVEEEYPANISTSDQRAPAVQARQAFHEKWLDNLRKFCSVDDQTAIILRVQAVKLSATGYNGRITMDDVMTWAGALSKLFEEEADAIAKVNSKEMVNAVRRGMPIEMRQVVDNSKPTDPEHKDNWESIVARTAGIVREYEELLPAMTAVEGRSFKETKYSGVNDGNRENRFDRKGKGAGRGKGKGKGKNHEDRRNQRGGGRGSYNWQSTSTKRKQDDEQKDESKEREEKLAKIQCFTCGKFGHYSDKCPEADSTSAGETPAAGFRSKSPAKKGKGKGKGKGGKKA